MVKVALRLKKIPAVYKSLKRCPTIRVGILGSKASQQHDDSNLTNAEIGAIQEFGSVANNIPPRSFLRQPLQSYLDKVLRNWKHHVSNGILHTKFAYKIGEMAVVIIRQAFESGGFGRWAPNKPATLRAKAPETKPLINTRQLRDSVTYEVIDENH